MKNFFKTWGPLMIFCSTMLIMVIDTTMMNVSISAIVNDLGTTVGSVQNAVTIYALVMAAFMITGAKLGERFGMKKVFLLGMIVYGCGTATAALAPSIAYLTLGWSILEGLGSALMMPIVMMLILSIYKGHQRVLAFALVGGVQAGASALGPIVGGFLTTYYSWRYGFALELIFVAFALIAGPFWLKATKPQKMKIDIAGVVLSAATMALIVGGIITGNSLGFWYASTDISIMGISPAPFILVAGLLAGAGFYLLEKARIRRNPLINVNIFRNMKFVAGVSSGLVQSLVIAGVMFINPIFLQKVVGLNAMDTGLVVLPMSIAIFLASIISPRLVKKHDPKVLTQWGCLFVIAGALLIKKVWAVDMVGTDLTLGYIVFGVGVGLVLAQLNNLTLSSVEEKFSTDASGLNNTFRNLGSSLGTAIMGAVFFTVLSSSVLSGIEQKYNLPEAQAQSLMDDVKKNVDEMAEDAELAQSLTDEQKSELSEIVKIADKSSVHAMSTVYDFLAGFGVLCLILSFYLPNKNELKS